ncbi:hypothetical protein SapgrDRAFT_3084, partial [Saprospira grandis DSM 2844]
MSKGVVCFCARSTVHFSSPICIDWHLGPPAFGGRYVRQLAVRSAL